MRSAVLAQSPLHGPPSGHSRTKKAVTAWLPVKRSPRPPRRNGPRPPPRPGSAAARDRRAEAAAAPTAADRPRPRPPRRPIRRSRRRVRRGGRGRDDRRHRPAPARRGDRRHPARGPVRPARDPRARRRQPLRAARGDRPADPQRPRPRRGGRPGHPAQRPPHLRLLRDTRHPARGDRADRRHARGGRAQIWLSRRPEGGELRPQPPLQRLYGRGRGRPRHRRRPRILRRRAQLSADQPGRPDQPRRRISAAPSRCSRASATSSRPSRWPGSSSAASAPCCRRPTSWS